MELANTIMERDISSFRCLYVYNVNPPRIVSFKGGVSAGISLARYAKYLRNIPMLRTGYPSSGNIGRLK